MFDLLLLEKLLEGRRVEFRPSKYLNFPAVVFSLVFVAVALLVPFVPSYLGGLMLVALFIRAGGFPKHEE